MAVSFKVLDQLKMFLIEKDIDKLDLHLKDSVWKEYSVEEQKILSKLLLLKAEKHLEKKEYEEASEAFTLLKSMAKQFFSTLYNAGYLLSSYKNNVSFLKLACHFFKLALKTHQTSFNAWHALATTKVQLGIHMHEEKYFYQALQIFDKAEECLKKRDHDTHALFFRHKGMCYYFLGLFTDEPVEFSRSLHEYEKAYLSGQNSVSFWNDYGNSCIELAMLINDLSLVKKAIQAFWRCTEDPNMSLYGWQNLAYAYHSLYQGSYEDAHFLAAERCYKTATSLCQDHPYLWLRFGNLLSTKGREEECQVLLELAHEKYEISDILKPDSVQTLLNWAKNNLYLGTLTKNSEYIFQAIQHIQRILILKKDSAQGWNLLACAFYELGKLKKDIRYLEKSVSKFRKALFFDQKNVQIWKGLASCKLVIHSIASNKGKQQSNILKDALKTFEYAAHLNESVSIEFVLEWAEALIIDYHTTRNLISLEGALLKYEKCLDATLNKTNDSVPLELLLDYCYALELLAEHTESIDPYMQSAEIYKKILADIPDMANVQILYAKTQRIIGTQNRCLNTLQQAIKFYQKALSVDAELSEGWMGCGLCLLEIGVIYNDLLKEKLALKYLIESERCLLQANTYNHKDAAFSLVCLYAKLYQEEKALYYLDRVLSGGSDVAIDVVINHPYLEHLRQKNEFWMLIKEVCGNDL